MIATQLFVTMIEIISQDLVQDQDRENLEHKKENLDLDLVRFRKHEKENLVRGLDHGRKDLDLSHKGRATTTTKLIGRTTTTTIGPNLRHQKLLYPS